MVFVLTKHFVIFDQQINKAMLISSLPITEEEVGKVFSAPPQIRVQRQNELVAQLGIPVSGKTPFMDYIHHLQKLNGIEVTNDIQPELNMAIDNDPQARKFLMIIG
jgi:hypothetical protein